MTADEARLLKENLSSCRERIESLKYSLNKNLPIFPLNLETLSRLSAEQKEAIDALILRYSQCVSMIQDQLFRSIALAEQEDIHAKSNRDKSLLMEKLGALKSADDFSVAIVLRNKFAHHYPEESRKQLDRLNLLIKESKFVIDVFDNITRYLADKHLLMPVILSEKNDVRQ
ncbi:hypothetical protein [Methylomonas fluvii]|uniref:Uncharacterized protein n=1 Tax=Methylomonas fluvii TaxID=1854564 RepID=A0ABR9DJH2_9GAMM|nr:hypothetical protein [Methylomonas fluvii]MBD9362468.1 hypothetical protein [Methylomonas fluvii]